MSKVELHRLVDELPEAAVEPAGVLLRRAAADPMLAVLDAAPVDDEPLTAEEEADAAEGLAAYRRGEGVELARVMAELDTVR